ncbi:MAG: CRISPR-associated endoribonuclease Cas6 [bacterium]|nr:CRISPR-associated endoribonuclease Cas6 [bacterium]
MRLKVTLASQNDVILPVNHQHMLQGFIYRTLTDEKMQHFLHDHGFHHEKRIFKLFAFSRLMGSCVFNQREKEILFYSPFTFYISSPWEEFLQNLLSGIVGLDDVFLGHNNLTVSEVSVQETPSFDDRISYDIGMLSPVTVYSTLYTAEGSKKTYYYSHTEKEFSELIQKNLIKKGSAFLGQDWSELPFSIKRSDNAVDCRQITVNYKNTIIKGWIGDFTISGHPLMLRMAYDAGIGSKNSQGFGLFNCR